MVINKIENCTTVERINETKNWCFQINEIDVAKLSKKIRQDTDD